MQRDTSPLDVTRISRAVFFSILLIVPYYFFTNFCIFFLDSFAQQKSRLDGFGQAKRNLCPVYFK